MKKYQIVVIAVLLSTFSFASDGFKSVVLLSSENKNVVLAFNGFENIETSIMINDQFETVLFQETKKSPKLLPTQFSLNELKGNIFMVRIENKYKVIEVIYKFDNNKAIIEEQPIEVFKPIFYQKEGEVLIYLLNPLEKKVIIDILDEDGNELVPTMVSTKLVIQKTLDFSEYRSKAMIKIKNGKYFIKKVTY